MVYHDMEIGDQAEHRRNESNLLYSNVFAIIAICLAIVSTGLVSAWATGDDTSYLPYPNWTDAPMGWHPILMVGGFFLSMVVAISAWPFNNMCKDSKMLGKLYHFFIMCAAIFTGSIGLAAAVKYESAQNLTSLHSWIGVFCFAMFGFTFCWGAFMSFLTSYFPNSSLRSAISWLPIHKVGGTFTMILSVMAIETGIMDYLGSGACSASVNGTNNPVTNYPNTPGGCKIGNGLGITIIFCIMAVFLSVYFRALYLKKW